MSYNSEYYRFYLLSMVIFFLFVMDISAQQKKYEGLSPEIKAWTISTMEPWPEDKYKTAKEAMIDNKIYFPMVFRGYLLPENIFKYSRESLFLSDYNPSKYNLKSIQPSLLFEHYFFKKRLNDSIYKNVMLKDPSNFLYTIRQLPGTVIRNEIITVPRRNAEIEKKTVSVTPETVDPVVKFIPDRKYWKSTFSADIKFSQNRTSANWYKGEINNINIYTNTNTSYNYSKDKLSLTNTLTTTFTINNAPSDTLRKYTIGSDELRFRSNFGLKAIKNWSYSASGEFVTSMGNKYITNTKTKNSSFLAPYTINAGVGMTFNPQPKFKKKDRSLSLSLSLEPLSFKYMYSRNKDINLGAYFQKNEEGEYMNVLRTFGSTILMTKTTKFSQNVSWYSRMYYFTNYERVIGEFENKFDIALSRYFSTTIYLYLRYDDGVAKKEESDSYLQINEMFSFGFSYKW